MCASQRPAIKLLFRAAPHRLTAVDPLATCRRHQSQQADAPDHFVSGNPLPIEFNRLDKTCRNSLKAAGLI